MVSTIAAGASPEYYLQEQADYYTDGKEPRGTWYAPNEDFGLVNQSEIQKADFLHLHAGANLKGETLVTSPEMLRNRVGAYDMTFSAPKSVSVLWAASDAETQAVIERVQDKATRDALGMLNKNAVFARRGKGGAEQEAVRLTAALFQHGEARPTGKDAFDLKADPQMHTHAVILNLAQRVDGTFGALDGRHLFRWKMAAGAVYRASLAEGLQRELGAEVERTDPSGLFEIKGVPKAVRDHFSQRRAEIVADLAELGLESRNAQQSAAKVAKSSRSSKEAVAESRPDQFNRWQHDANSLGFGKHEAKACLNHVIDEKQLSADFEQRITTVVAELTEHESVFQKKDLVAKVAAAATGTGIEQQTIEKRVEAILAGGQVVALEHDALGQAVYSTRDQIALEQDVQMLASRIVAKSQHRLAKAPVSRTLETTSLSFEQKAAVEAGSLAVDLVIIEGAAGSGKSYSLRALSDLYSKSGYRVIGSATAWKAANQLGEDSGIESKATDAWLASADAGGKFLDRQTVLIVDEAGQMSAGQMHRILSAVESAGSKVILTGDQKQLQSIGAGPGLRLVAEKTGITRIDTIRRQEDLWARTATVDFAEGRTEKGVGAFDRRGLLKLCSDHGTTLREVVDTWANEARLFPEQASMVIARTNREVEELNQLMRAKLRAAGTLAPDILSLSISGGKTLALAEGDLVRFTKRIDALGVVNGTLAHVEKIEGSTLSSPRLSLRFGGKSRKVALANLLSPKGEVPLRYGYASTLYAAQGATVDRAYVVAHPAMKRNDLYVAVSRARKQTKLFVDREGLSRSLLDGKLLSNRQRPDLTDQKLKSLLVRNWSRANDKISALDYLSPISSKVISAVPLIRKSVNLLPYQLER